VCAILCLGWFTLATEAESESEAQGALRSSVNQKEESEAESEARRTSVRRIRRASFSSDSASAFVASVVPIHTRSELSSDSDSAYDSASVASVASVNQPLLCVVDRLVSTQRAEKRGNQILKRIKTTSLK